jgi:hypothetical protein
LGLLLHAPQPNARTALQHCAVPVAPTLDAHLASSALNSIVCFSHDWRRLKHPQPWGAGLVIQQYFKSQ